MLSKWGLIINRLPSQVPQNQLPLRSNKIKWKKKKFKRTTRSIWRHQCRQNCVLKQPKTKKAQTYTAKNTKSHLCKTTEGKTNLFSWNLGIPAIWLLNSIVSIKLHQPTQAISWGVQCGHKAFPSAPYVKLKNKRIGMKDFIPNTQSIWHLDTTKAVMKGHPQASHSELHYHVKRLKLSCMNSMICQGLTNKILKSWINIMKGFRKQMQVSSRTHPSRVHGTKHQINWHKIRSK